MEQKQAQQVWQRVHPGAAGLAPELPGLWKLALTQQSIFRQLAPALGEAARDLERRYGDSAAVLRGMLVLSGKTPGPPVLPPLPRLTRQRLLEEAVRNSRVLAMAYTAGSALGAFSTAFPSMARQEEQRQLDILALAGR